MLSIHLSERKVFNFICGLAITIILMLIFSSTKRVSSVEYTIQDIGVDTEHTHSINEFWLLKDQNKNKERCELKLNEMMNLHHMDEHSTQDIESYNAIRDEFGGRVNADPTHFPIINLYPRDQTAL